MPSEIHTSECGCSSKASGSATWITLIAAVGVTATAFFIAKRIRQNSVQARAENLFDACDRAAQMLDDRLGVRDALYAAS